MGTLRRFFNQSVVLLLCAQVSALIFIPTLARAQSDLLLDLEVSVNKDTTNSREVAIFAIKFSASSTTVDAYNAKIEVHFPDAPTNSLLSSPHATI